MGLERVALQREQQTLLMTLDLHARDAESAHPVLADRHARMIMDRLDYDFTQLRDLSANRPVIITRAKAIDDRVRDFLSTHPDAVVLHLGCGLDSRVLRIDPGPQVTWIELDLGPVIELRRRLYPERDGVTTIAASVTDSGWWDAVPSGRPILAVGEGLLMYLAPGEIVQVVDTLLGRPAPKRTLLFDTVAKWVRRAAQLQPAFRKADAGFRSSTEDFDAAVRTHPEATLVEELSLVHAARSVRAGPVLGAFVAAFDTVPAGRRGMVLRTYRAP